MISRSARSTFLAILALAMQLGSSETASGQVKAVGRISTANAPCKVVDGLVFFPPDEGSALDILPGYQTGSAALGALTSLFAGESELPTVRVGSMARMLVSHTCEQGAEMRGVEWELWFRSNLSNEKSLVHRSSQDAVGGRNSILGEEIRAQSGCYTIKLKWAGADASEVEQCTAPRFIQFPPPGVIRDHRESRGKD